MELGEPVAPLLMLRNAGSSPQLCMQMTANPANSHVFLLTDLTVVDGRGHVAGYDDVSAEVLLNQVGVQRVGSMWSLVSRA